MIDLDWYKIFRPLLRKDQTGKTVKRKTISPYSHSHAAPVEVAKVAFPHANFAHSCFVEITFLLQLPAGTISRSSEPIARLLINRIPAWRIDSYEGGNRTPDSYRALSSPRKHCRAISQR